MDTEIEPLWSRGDRMARRWSYTKAERNEMQALLKADPDNWERAIALDERREPEFRQQGLIK